MKAFRGEGVELHSFLTSALDGDEWFTSGPGRFTPQQEKSVPIEWKAGYALSPSGNYGEEHHKR
jgi:hypothetical protein